MQLHQQAKLQQPKLRQDPNSADEWSDDWSDDLMTHEEDDVACPVK